MRNLKYIAYALHGVSMNGGLDCFLCDDDCELYDMLQKKMTINFNRSWKKQANGSYHH